MPERAAPAPPEGLAGTALELEKLRYQALLDLWKAEIEAERLKEAERWKLAETRRDERVKAEDALRAAVHAAYLDASKNGLERSLKRVNFVTAGAAAIATTYTGLLALVFSVSGQVARPMPATGMGPAVFLGVSLVLSVFYAAYLSEVKRPGRYLGSGLGPVLQEVRMVTFVAWVAQGVLLRAWALRLSVLSLGIGVALTPLPFLDLTEASRWKLIGLGVFLLVLAAGWEISAPLRRRLADKKATRGKPG